MQANRPHYLLYSAADCPAYDGPRWHFTLQSLGGQEHLTASDIEPGTQANRLELLAVVRGLEALEQPSRVTLLTHSRYVYRGLRRGLSQWRDRQWQWERFGQLVPIRNHDLWRRIDRALEYHEIECCQAELDAGTAEATYPRAMPALRQEQEVAAMSQRPESFAIDVPTLDRTTTAWPIPAPVTAADESMLPVVPRRETRHARRAACEGRQFSNIFRRLRQTVLAPLTSIWRPAFTRAA